MKLGDFLNNQATKLGLQNNPALVSILSNSDLANREIEDDFANLLNNGLISVDGAKNNLGLKNHFSATILNGIDAKLLEDIDLDEETLSAVQAEKSTYNKISIVKNALKSEIEKLKNGGSEDKTKKAEIEKQIKDLNNQLLTAKQKHQEELSSLKSQYDSEIQDFLFTNHLAGKAYANKDLTAEENTIFAKTLIAKELKDKGAIMVKDGNKLVLKNASSPELDFYDDNKPITAYDFFDKVLASKKMLAVNGNTTPQSQQQQQPTQQQFRAPAEDVKMRPFMNAMQSAQNDLNSKQE